LGSRGAREPARFLHMDLLLIGARFAPLFMGTVYGTDFEEMAEPGERNAPVVVQKTEAKADLRERRKDEMVREPARHETEAFRF